MEMKQNIAGDTGAYTSMDAMDTEDPGAIRGTDTESGQLTQEDVLALVEENNRLRQELRIRDNDILSQDQVFDSIVSGTSHLILVMSVTSYTAEFVTSNIVNALGIGRTDVMEDVRRMGSVFKHIVVLFIFQIWLRR